MERGQVDAKVILAVDLFPYCSLVLQRYVRSDGILFKFRVKLFVEEALSLLSCHGNDLNFFYPRASNEEQLVKNS